MTKKEAITIRDILNGIDGVKMKIGFVSDCWFGEIYTVFVIKPEHLLGREVRFLDDDKHTLVKLMTELILYSVSKPREEPK